MSARKIAYITLGCKANQYDTGTMETALNQAGYVTADRLSEADFVVINSCTVTAESDRKTRQTVRRVHKQCPLAAIIVAGCSSQRTPEDYAAMEGVIGVLGTSGRSRVVDIVKAHDTGSIWNEPVGGPGLTYEDEYAAAMHRARGNLKIQDGCDRYCTYCIIPYVRGPIRSREMDSILSEARAMADSGIREIVLTGIRLAAYGQDKTTDGDIMDAAAAVAGSVPGIRVRLGSLDPDCISEDMIKRAADIDGFCPHFHLSLQSGSDTVLRRMARRYTAAEFMAVTDNIRKYMPDAGITADVLCGFVGETDQEHRQTMELIRKVEFSRIHVFPYSKREGTAAARMQGHLPRQVKQDRCRELCSLGSQLEAAFMKKFVGTTRPTIFETCTKDNMTGHTDNYIEVSAPLDRSKLYKITDHMI